MDNQRADGSIQHILSAIPLPVWIMAPFIILLAGVIGVLWALYLRSGGLKTTGPTPTAIIWTVTPSPVPTVSPSPSPTQIAQPTPTASPDIAIGDRVKVVGTDGYGLSLREGPGTNYARQGVAAEGETFVVIEGPTTAGGSPWWKIRDPENEDREWWASGNYLEPIKEP